MKKTKRLPHVEVYADDKKLIKKMKRVYRTHPEVIRAAMLMLKEKHG